VASTFKDGVFDEVADAVELRRLVTRTSTHPNPGSHGPEARHVFCQDGDAVGEFCRLNVVDHPMEA
jgi:hypothetical protein